MYLLWPCLDARNRGSQGRRRDRYDPIESPRPLAPAQPDNLAGARIEPAETNATALALSIHQASGCCGRLDGMYAWWIERANPSRVSLRDPYPSKRGERGYVAQRPRAGEGFQVLLNRAAERGEIRHLNKALAIHNGIQRVDVAPVR